ncbi:MAG: PKD domain-containing protein [Phototrophicaceae bacterium]
MSACTLGNNPQQAIEITDVPTITVPPSRTPIDVANLPTALPTFTAQALQIFPTVGFVASPVAILPPTIMPQQPTNPPTPINIVMLSPLPGSILAGNIQLLGSAVHPQFLQFNVEYAPEPNPNNLWFPITGAVQTPVSNGIFGVWDTTTAQDNLYQLRLRVTLKDGTSLATVVNNVRVQNRQPTPVPTNTSIPLPIAAFTQDVTTGLFPLNVQFVNQSQGIITAYRWNFGDGSTSTEINPKHTFANPGLYTVVLEVIGQSGTTNVSRQIAVQSPVPPVAAFTQSSVSGTAPLTINFTDQSQGDITSRDWQFGDGSTSNAVSPSHTFNLVGTYNVILTVKGSGGSSSVTRQITVQNPQVPLPKANFTANPASGDAPLAVNFKVTDTSNITNYAWTFGTLGVSSEVSPSFTFNDAGTYNVQLVVTGAGGQASSTMQVTVNQVVLPPVVAIDAQPTSGERPLSVQFNAISSGGAITSYLWDFGDGVTATGATTTHEYMSAGDYLVTLKATGAGGEVTATSNIQVIEPSIPLQASFVANPTSGTAPLTVMFDSSASTGSISSYGWDFGDGVGFSNEPNPSYTYNNAGDYLVTLTVTDAQGVTAISQTTLSITSGLKASFVANPTSGTTPLTVVFDSSASTGSISSYGWDFGDGVGFSNEPNPSYTYNNAGDYLVTLTVTDAQGVTAISQTTLSITSGLKASFVANPTSGTTPLTVVFDSSASTGSISSYGWDFGDGVGFSNEPNPSYTYNNAGDYLVTLTLSDVGGTLSSATTTINVSQLDVMITEPSSVLFVSNATGTAQLYGMSSDGLAVQQLTNSATSIGDFAWSSQDQIAFTSDSLVYIMSFDTSNLTPLLVDGITALVGNSLDWSPDGERLVYRANESGVDDLFIINRDGSAKINLTNSVGNHADPDWSQEGSQIVFVSDRDGNNELYLMDADGLNVVRLTISDAQELQPAWSPDNSQIAYVSNQDGNYEIYLMSADGTNPQRLTDYAGTDEQPTWSEDGSSLLFVSDRDGVRGVYSMNLDGTNIQRLTDPYTESISPASRP